MAGPATGRAGGMGMVRRAGPLAGVLAAQATRALTEHRLALGEHCRSGRGTAEHGPGASAGRGRASAADAGPVSVRTAGRVAVRIPRVARDAGRGIGHRARRLTCGAWSRLYFGRTPSWTGHHPEPTRSRPRSRRRPTTPDGRGDLLGRQREMALLDGLLDQIPTGSGRHAPLVSRGVRDGGGGQDRRWPCTGHKRWLSAYPDGQLYANLRGSGRRLCRSEPNGHCAASWRRWASRASASRRRWTSAPRSTGACSPAGGCS